MVTWPSGKARVCKTLIHQFKSGRHLQKFPEAAASGIFVLLFFSPFPCYNGDTIFAKGAGKVLLNSSEYLNTVFALAYPDEEFVQQPVAQIPWGHNTVLLDKLSSPEERLWYAEKVIENGWSRNVLIHQIESGLYQRQAIASKITNFEARLPASQSELALQTMKDPYLFDFIPLKENMLERDIEQALVKDVTKLLLELGTGFAFLGNQYHLNVGGDDFYIDLLFYNLNLRCYVVIELKTGEFKPEYAGQLNFYLSAVDGLLKKEQDHPSIGLLLCKSKNDLVAEYSLKDMSKPIGVSAYRITSCLPEEFEKQLPSVEDLQKRIL